jgi:DNA-binding transcriptional MocR family regulator
MQDFLYLSVAGRLEALIQQQALRAGQKMPSVRQLSQEQRVSMSTAFQAYYHLESKGLVEARPKSGYYVRATLRPQLPLPRLTAPQPEPQRVTTETLMQQLFVEPTATGQRLHLSQAIPALELLPVAKLKKAMQRVVAGSAHGGLAYAHAQGNPELRQQIVRLAFQGGSAVTADEVIVTAGAMQAVTLCLQALTQPGDVVAVESPTYYAFFEALESLHLRVVEIPTDPTTGIELAALETAIRTQQVRVCLLTPTFSNPLGSCLPDEQKQALVAMLARYQVPLIEDDVYGDVHFGAVRPRTCHSFDTTGNVLLCSSFSKTLAPGYRVGWILPGRYREQLAHRLHVFNRAEPTLTQAALADFLARGRYDLHLLHLRRTLHAQYLQYREAVEAAFPAGTRVSQPQGGYVLWVELPPAADALRVQQRALQEGIILAPGRLFTLQSIYQNCLRISYGQPFTEQVSAGLNRVGQLVAQDCAAVAATG